MYYDAIFKAYKEYIESNSQYSPRVVKINTNTSTYFPIIVFPKPNSRSGGMQTQNHIDKSRNNYITIEQYAKNKDNVPAQVIIDELSELSLQFFEKLNIENTLDELKPNLDNNILRNIQQFQFNVNNRGIITNI